jgi:hypothetical protein
MAEHLGCSATPAFLFLWIPEEFIMSSRVLAIGLAGGLFGRRRFRGRLYARDPQDRIQSGPAAHGHVEYAEPPPVKKAGGKWRGRGVGASIANSARCGEVKNGKLLLVVHGTADDVERAKGVLHQTKAKATTVHAAPVVVAM